MHIGLGLYRHMLNAEYFSFAQQIGCSHLIIHLADYYSHQVVTATDEKHNYGESRKDDEIWNDEYLLSLKELASRFGLTIYGIENFNPVDWYDVLLDGPRKEEQMAHLKEIIRMVGRVGIKSFGYNFSIAGVWGHQHKHVARGGAESVCFDASVLNIDAPIPNGQIWNMTYDSSTSEGFIPPVSSEELWRRYEWFLKEILPVAEKSGVEMALHPDDPPMPCLRQAARLVYQPELYQRVIEIDSSPANKFEFCMGSLQEMTHGDIYQVTREYLKQGRISYVHFRNVKGKVPCYDEVFIDEGDIDMYKALRIFAEYDFDGVLIPDHTPLITHGGDPWKAGMAYAVGYMNALVKVIEEG